MRLRRWQFRISRLAGRIITRIAAFLTLERMPPFVSVSAMVVDGGRILAVIDPRFGDPVLPGGHVKWREKLEEALIREVREETGYVVEPVTLLGAFAADEPPDEPGVVRLLYAARVVSGELRSSPEGDAVWVLIDDLTSSESRDAGLVRRFVGEDLVTNRVGSRRE